MKICNNLLRSLSVQAWKKIEETKKKAVDITHVRKRNQDHVSEKQMLSEQRAREDHERAERNAAARDN